MSKLIRRVAILRLIEIVIMYFGMNWIYNTFPEEYGIWVVVGMMVLYLVYAGIHTYNEYREEVYGDENKLQ